jgi:hypothetical protein
VGAVSDDGFTAFGRTFSGRVANFQDDLRQLESEGVTYQQWILEDDDGGPGLYRVRFSPTEIYRYVNGVVGWDEYLDGGFDAVNDRALAEEASASATDRAAYDENSDGPCMADFIGDEAEALVCGWRLERAQRIHPSGSAHDAITAVHQIAAGLPVAIKSLSERSARRPTFAIGDERDFQDILFLILRSLFDDVRREEWTPSLAGNAKRVDLAIPTAGLFVEAKVVRDRSHGRRLADELRIDIESYHSHPACSTLVALVWDPARHLADPAQLARDLTGPRTKSSSSFDVAVRII